MGKKSKSLVNSTESIFKRIDAFYSQESMVGETRWSTLKPALLEPRRLSARMNGFFGTQSRTLGEEIFPDNEILLESPLCFDLPLKADKSIAEPRIHEGEKLIPYYIMDLASILAAKSLSVKPGESVLDLCAAPGGKTLVLAESITNGGTLIANELNRPRRFKLQRIMQEYIPAKIRERVEVIGYDGSKIHQLFELPTFDAILVDAPCSSERHVFTDSKELKLWSESRSKREAKRQAQILYAAANVVKVGGRILYSTCSISPLENDSVVSRVLKKHKYACLEVRPLNIPLGEPTPIGGWQILPDKCDGFGPIYMCLLERVESREPSSEEEASVEEEEDEEEE